MEEKNLLDRVVNGDSGAFKDLVDHFQGNVLNTCYRFLDNREDAEEVTQDVFVEVHRSIGTFRGDSKLSTWIYRISVTKSLDHIRRRKRKKRFARIQSIFSFGEDNEELPIVSEDNPEKDLENHDRAKILRTAVESLTENQRVAITLNKYEGFSYQEVAEIMDVSISAVESLIHRAKNNLRKILSDYYESLF